MGEIYCWEKRRKETGEGNCNTLSKTLHSHFHCLKRRQVYSSFLRLILTLHSQHRTSIEALTEFLFPSEQKSLQLIAFYSSFTSHSPTLQSEGCEHHTALAPNHHLVQCRAVRDDELTLLPTQGALANLNGLDGGVILTLEGSHVGKGEGGAGEGLEAGELGEIDGCDGVAVGELSITGNLHKRRGEGIRVGGVGEVVGSGSNELFQSGGIYSSRRFMTLTLSNQCVNVTERGRQINLDVFTNVCSSVNQSMHTLQCNDRTGCKLHATLSVQMAERRQINHSQGTAQGLLVRSGIQNSSIFQTTKWRFVKKEISEGRKVWKWNEWKALTDERNGRSLKKGLVTQWNSLKRRQVYSITSFHRLHLATQTLIL